MATYSSPTDPTATSLAKSSDINNVDAAAAAAFALLPTNANINAGTTNFAVDTGAANAYLAALPMTAGSYTDGLQVVMRPLNANTGACTINVDSLGVKPIKTESSTNPSANDIVAGVPVELRYSASTGYFHIIKNSAAAASAAAASAAAALVSENAASVSASSAASLYDSFDDRYLGAKAVEPTLDNDGNALITGAMYFNTVSSGMKVYSGTAWLVIGASEVAGDGIDVTFLAGQVTIAANLKANGGIVIEATEMALDLSASSITGTLAVGDGGTGRATSTTAYGLLAAGTTATGAHQTLAAGLTTQILVGGGTGALPAWGTDLPTAVTIGSAYIYRAAGTDVPVTDGGTGASTLTDHGVLVGSGTDPVTTLVVGTNGQVLVGSTGADPVFATITDGEGIDTTLGAGTLTIAAEIASDTNPGVIEIATDAEAIAGSDTARAITAANLKSKLGAQTDGGLLVGAGQTSAVEAVPVGLTTEILVGGGAATNPVWTTATGTGAPVRAVSPTIFSETLSVNAATTSFAGTISAASTTATFTSAADYALCKVGSTIISNAQTRYVCKLLGSNQVTLDQSTTWAASSAITSIQDPQSTSDLSGTSISFTAANGSLTVVLASDGSILFHRTVDGKEGIGTTGPAQKLQVGSGNGINVRLGDYGSIGTEYSGVATTIGMNAQANTATAQGMNYIATLGSLGASAIRMYYGDGITFHTYSGATTAGSAFTSERMRIDNQGNVGIGTTSPTGKLHVLGTGSAPSLTTSAASLVNITNGTTSLVTTIDNSGSPYAASIQHRHYNTDGNYYPIALNPLGGNVGIGTTDLDGTPAVGRLTIKGSTNDGSTQVQVWRDSDEANVASLDTNGNFYTVADVSALTFTDRTPFYEGDALAALATVVGKDGGIDHMSLPVFAQKKIRRTVYSDGLEVLPEDAFETVDIEEDEMEEITDEKGEAKKQPIVLSMKQVQKGFKLENNMPVPNIVEESVHKKVSKQVTRIKENVRFNDKTGTFHQREYQIVEEDGRDLGAMISILVKAIQQLQEGKASK